jgi:16S rRNA G1207 methylase RsmC
VTDSSTAAVELSSWLAAQLPAGTVTTATGFYAAVAAAQRGDPVVVADVGAGTQRQEWQLAELRTRLSGATVVVVAAAAHLATLAGALRADLALTSPADLPPLRELLLASEPALTGDQTSWRRTNR